MDRTASDPLVVFVLPAPISPAAGFFEGEKPFDVIHVGAASDGLPKELLDVLAPGGRMVIPLGGPTVMQVWGCCQLMVTAVSVGQNIMSLDARVPSCITL